MERCIGVNGRGQPLKPKKAERRRGRPIGAINKRTEQTVAAARKTGKLPHEIMLQIAQAAVGGKVTGWGKVDKEDKKWALYSCANYFAPKITATDHTGSVYIMALPQEALNRLNVVELELMEKVFAKLAANSDGHAPVALLPPPVYDPDE